MKIPGFRIILLILVLAGFAIVPIVCGEEQTNSVQATQNPCGGAGAPEHCIPPSYFKDSKPATPLSESAMITIIISEQTYDRFSPKDKPGIVVIPVSYLDFSTNFTHSTSSPTWHYEKHLISGNSLAMIRMPYSMYDRFITTANGNNLELPASAYIRHYENLADLHAHIEPDGMYLKDTANGSEDIGTQPSQTVPLIIVTTPRIIQTNSGTQPAPLPVGIAIIAIGCVVMMAAKQRIR
jgi:hypothetical protein